MSDPLDQSLVLRVPESPQKTYTERTPQSVIWPTDLIEPWLAEADAKGLSVVKIHCHPGYYPRFSAQDDKSDRDLFVGINDAIGADLPHASVIMLDDGRMFGRLVHPDGNFTPLRSVSVAGDDINIWSPYDFGQEPAPALPEFTRRHAKAFGEKTTRALRDLSIAVVGCSGTGSPTIAQLAHLGVGRLVLIDPDKVHELNLNRIYFATMADALAGRLKVDVLGDAVERLGLGTVVERHSVNLYTPEAVRAAAGCDVLIGCMDTAEGRFLLNLLSNFYVLPYLDLGVTIEAHQETGEIDQVCGYLHYVQPGGSSLLSRGVFTMEDVRAEGVLRQNPAYYAELKKAGYIKGVVEDRPAVISVNTVFAGLAVNEIIARLQGFRENPNRAYAKIGLSLSEVAFYPESEPARPCRFMSKQVGRGDVVPLLDQAELSEGDG